MSCVWCLLRIGRVIASHRISNNSPPPKKTKTDTDACWFRKRRQLAASVIRYGLQAWWALQTSATRGVCVMQQNAIDRQICLACAHTLAHTHTHTLAVESVFTRLLHWIRAASNTHDRSSVDLRLRQRAIPETLKIAGARIRILIGKNRMRKRETSFSIVDDLCDFSSSNQNQHSLQLKLCAAFWRVAWGYWRGARLDDWHWEGASTGSVRASMNRTALSLMQNWRWPSRPTDSKAWLSTSHSRCAKLVYRSRAEPSALRLGIQHASTILWVCLCRQSLRYTFYRILLNTFYVYLKTSAIWFTVCVCFAHELRDWALIESSEKTLRNLDFGPGTMWCSHVVSIINLCGLAGQCGSGSGGKWAKA